MAKAFLDTTVLTDYLLKTGQPRERAKTALAGFSDIELPMYAIKEFKGGPLNNFVWMYNKFVGTGSFALAISALHAMSRTPKRYTTSTALEALVAAAETIASKTPINLAKIYGEDAQMDAILRDEFRLSLKRKIYQAWNDRAKIATQVVYRLSCYDEQEPYENRNMLYVKPTRCNKGKCCLEIEFKNRKEHLKKMREAILQNGSNRREDQKRANALKTAARKPEYVTDDVCRDLGDAIFVALAPDDATILTTNLRDHSLLAGAVNKRVMRP